MPAFHNIQSTTLSVALSKGNTNKAGGLHLKSKEVTMAGVPPAERQHSVSSSTSQDSGYESLASSFITDHPVGAIQMNFTYLREHVNLEMIKDWLIQHDVIDEHLKDRLANTKLSFERKGKLLKELIRKGSDTCKKFLRCLREESLDQIHIFQQLKQLCRESLQVRQHSTFHITKQHLRENKTQLLRDIEAQTVADGLFECDLFNIDDHDQICSEQERMKKGMRLLVILESKDEASLDTFLHVLKQKGYTEIYEDLTNEQSVHYRQQKPKQARRLVQHNYRKVLDNTHAEVMMEYLKGENQLADTEYQTLCKYKDKTKQSRLVKTVIRKGEEACIRFVDGLISQCHRRGDLVNQMKTRLSSRTIRQPEVSLPTNFVRIHHDYLKEELEIFPLIDILFEEFVFDVHDHDSVEEKPHRSQKVSCLLASLLKVTNENFRTVNWAFEDEEYKHLLETLKAAQSPMGPSNQSDPSIFVFTHEQNIITRTQGHLPNINIELKLTADGELRDVIHDGVVQSLKQNHENRRAFEADAMTHTAMEIEDIDKGSIVVHVHPLTDDGVRQLMDATRNNKLNSFIQSMFKHANLSFLGSEPITLKVEMRKREAGTGKRRETAAHKERRPTHTDIEQSIKDNWNFLLDELEPRDLTRHFVEKGIFTQDEGKDLSDGEMTRRRRVDKFLKHVLSARNQGTDFFIKILKDHGSMHIIKKLDLESQDVHQRAECIRGKILKNFSVLLDEIESPMISHTMENCKNITDAQKQLILSRKGKSRKSRIQEFLKMILNNDEYVLEFERTAKEFGIWDLVKCEEDEFSITVSDRSEVQDQALPSIIFEGTFEIRIEQESGISKVTQELQGLMLNDTVKEPSPGPSEIPTPSRKAVKEPSPGPSEKPTPSRKAQPLKESTYKTAKSTDFSYSQHHEKKVVAAIDFGTTYSGYAYSTRDDMKRIHVCKSSRDSIDAFMSQKIPTSILLSPTKKVLSIGSKAEVDFTTLAEEDSHREHYFFSRFKMELHTSEKLHRNTVIRDSNGHRIHAMEVFKLYIMELKDMLIRDLDRAGTPVFHDEIFWVLTIPAIWNDAAKQFMREAAEKAGISPSNMTLALEPEVAALFVKECPVEVSKTHDSLATYDVGAKFLVMDLGGGTADLTVMEVTEDHSLKQLKFSCGGDWGGESVNREFWSLLEKLVGSNVIETYKFKYRNDYMEMNKQFEAKKRTLEDFVDIDLKLDNNFIDVFEEEWGEDLKTVIKERNFTDLFESKGPGKLTLRSLGVQEIFKPSLNKLLQAASEMLEYTTVAVTDIIMVGGFSDSKIVRERLKAKFQKHRVIEPMEASLAVLKGAVLYGHNPMMVSSRICKYTYGIEVSRPFMNSDPKDLEIRESGQRYCGKAFLKLVEKGQEMKIDSAVTSDDIEALYSDATFMSFNIYRSTEKEPTYVIEESCKYLGKLRVEFGPQKQKVKVWMRFGTSEIMVEGRDAVTSEPIPGSVTLDLLDNLES